MDKPTQEQWEELLRWCGFRHFVKTKYGRGVDMWEYPKPYGIKRNRSYLPNLDLNNLFKYAVPKVEDIKIRTGNMTVNTVVIKMARHLEKRISVVGHRGNEDLTLALFWALDKVREASNG